MPILMNEHFYWHEEGNEALYGIIIGVFIMLICYPHACSLKHVQVAFIMFTQVINTLLWNYKRFPESGLSCWYELTIWTNVRDISNKNTKNVPAWGPMTPAWSSLSNT